jgi:hypothetical protein
MFKGRRNNMGEELIKLDLNFENVAVEEIANHHAFC